MTRVFKSLRSRLFALIFAAVLPMLAIAWLAGMQLYHHAFNDVYRESETLAQSIFLGQEKHIAAAQQILLVLSATPAIIERKPGFCSIFQEVLRRQEIFANVGMTDVEGNAICMGAPKIREANFSDRLWFRKVRQGDGIVVGDYHLGVMVKEPVVIVAKPIMGKHREHLAYLFVSVSLSWFNRHNLGRLLPEGTELIFYDQNNVILHHESEPERWRGQPVTTAIQRIGVPDPETGVVEAYGGDGVSRLFSFIRMEGTSASDNAFIAVGNPTDIALAQARRFAVLSALAILGMSGGILLLAWFGTKRLVIEPIRRLIRQANAYAAGDLAQRSGVVASSELSELALALDNMARMLSERDYDLAQHLRAFDEHAIVSASDISGNIIYANNKFCEINQYTRDEVIGKNHRLINSDFHPSQFFTEMWKIISQGKVWHGNIRNRRKDGSYYWVASTIVPFLDETGLPQRYFSIRTDITHALAIDEELQRSEARFRLLAENSLDVISLHHPDGRYSYVSPSCERLLGYAPADLVGHDGYDLVHPDDVEKVRKMLHQPALLGEPAKCDYVRLRHKNGEHVWVDASAVPSLDNIGLVGSIQVSVRNVTMRKQMEDMLRLHDRAFAASGSGIVIFRRDDLRIEHANAAYSHIVGVSEADLPGRVWPVLTQMPWNADIWHLLHEAVVASIEWHAVVEAISFQGNHVWCDLFLSPVPSEEGVVTHYVAAISDVTELVMMKIALMRAKEEAEQASRAKSKFLSHVGHELRTPLNAIVGLAQLLETDSEAPLSEEQRDSVERILRAGWLLRDLVNDVLELSRIESGKLELKPIDINVFDLLRECVEVIAVQAAYKGLEIVNLSGECAQRIVRVDAKCLKQVVLNLLSNAVKYNREGGRVTVTCRCLNDNAMYITVSDTGIGIPLNRRDELFQYFNRLDAEKTNVPGVGVGLALCRHLVKLMGGNISMESVPGEGSSFTIEFPVAC